LECNSGTKGEQIAELVQKECGLMELDMSLCRRQGYDGAGNMAGVCSGAAKLIRSKFPKASIVLRISLTCVLPNCVN